MSIQVSAFSVRALLQAPDVVVPRDLPLSPPRFLKANWKSKVSIRTRWQSDITSAFQTLAEDRRSLSYRPIRTMSAALSGLGRDEAYALESSIRRCAQQIVPVPLYPDITRLSEDCGASSLVCSTAYRRFFPGARVLVVHPSATQNYTLEGGQHYGIIKTVDARGIELEGPLPGTFPKDSSVFPCMDAEVTFRSRGQAITDGVYTVQFSVEEAFGENTLPPIWRGPITAFHATTAVTDISDPFFGSYLPASAPPLLGPNDFLPQWRSRITYNVVRGGKTVRSGRGAFSDVRGARPQTSLTWEMLQLNRYETFRLMAAFDGLQGRRQVFWALDPIKQWEFVTSTGNPTMTAIQVSFTGNLDDLRLIKHVYVMPIDAFGNQLRTLPVSIMEIESVTKIGTDAILTFALGTAAQNFGTPLAVGPAYLMHFDTDEIAEEWTVDTVMSTSLRAIEVLSEEPVGVANLPDWRDVVTQEAVPAQVGNPQFWFEAGSNTLQWQSLPNRYVRSAPWPGRLPYVDLWLDARARVRDSSALLYTERLPQGTPSMRLVAGQTHYARVHRFSGAPLSGGNLVIPNPRFRARMLESGSSEWDQVPIAERMPWSDDGWTLFIAAIGGVADLSAVAADYVMQIKDSAGALLFDWQDKGFTVVGSNETRRGRVRLYSAPGVVSQTLYPRSFYGNDAGSYSFSKGPIIAVLRVSGPGAGIARMWFNGDQYAGDGSASWDPSSWWNSSTVSANPQPSALPAVQPTWFQNFDDGAPATAVLDTSFGKVGALQAVISYRRVLSNAEINLVAGYLQNQFRGYWEDL